MAKKVDIELVQVVLQKADIDAVKTAQIIEDLKFESQQRDNDPDKELPVKRQFSVIVSDPYGKIAETGFDYQCWVVQIPEDDTPMQALERLNKGVYDFNLTPKGRRMPLKTVAEACEFGSPKIFNEHKIWVKTKDPVLLVRSNGKIPREIETE